MALVDNENVERGWARATGGLSLAGERRREQRLFEASVRSVIETGRGVARDPKLRPTEALRRGYKAWGEPLNEAALELAYKWEHDLAKIREPAAAAEREEDAVREPEPAAESASERKSIFSSLRREPEEKLAEEFKLRISSSQRRDLKRLAKLLGVSESELTRRFLAERLALEESLRVLPDARRRETDDV